MSPNSFSKDKRISFSYRLVKSHNKTLTHFGLTHHDHHYTLMSLVTLYNKKVFTMQSTCLRKKICRLVLFFST